MTSRGRHTAWITSVVPISAGLFFATIFVHAVAHYPRYLAGWPRIAAYFVLPLVLAAAMFGSLLLRPVQRAKLSVLLATTVVCVYALELFASYRSEHAVERRARSAGVPYDGRSRLEVMRDLRSRNIRAYPSLYPTDLVQSYLQSPGTYPLKLDGEVFLPLAGVANASTVYCNEAGPYIVYESDEHGFHNPPGTWAEKIRIALIGDSFAQGHCVPSSRNLAATLRARYPGTLSLGMGGNGPLLELATLREYLGEVRPDVVLWLYFEGNDIGMDLDLEKRHPILERYLREPTFVQDLPRRQASVDRELERFITSEAEYEPAEERSFSLERLRRFLWFESLRRALGLAFGRSGGDFPRFAEALGQAQAAVRSWDGEIYLVYLPARNRYSRSFFAKKDDSARARVLEIARGLGLPVIDMHDAFTRAPGSPLEFFDWGLHYNEAGYALTGRTILAALEPELEPEPSAPRAP